MADQNYQSMSGARSLANLRQTDLANATLHLFKAGFAPAVTTPLADFQANEADYEDYAAAVIAAWNEPILAALPGYNLTAPVQTFICTGDQDPANVIGGYFLVHSDGVTLIGYGTFDPTRPMQLGDQAVVVYPVIFFPAGV